MFWRAGPAKKAACKRRPLASAGHDHLIGLHAQPKVPVGVRSIRRPQRRHAQHRRVLVGALQGHSRCHLPHRLRGQAKEGVSSGTRGRGRRRLCEKRKSRECNASGPSVSGKPCPRLTAPYSTASADMTVNIVVGSEEKTAFIGLALGAPASTAGGEADAIAAIPGRRRAARRPGQDWPASSLIAAWRWRHAATNRPATPRQCSPIIVQRELYPAPAGAEQSQALA